MLIRGFAGITWDGRTNRSGGNYGFLAALLVWPGQRPGATQTLGGVASPIADFAEAFAYGVLE